jgi:hypothetical protein
MNERLLNSFFQEYHFANHFEPSQSIPTSFFIVSQMIFEILKAIIKNFIKQGIL